MKQVRNVYNFTQNTAWYFFSTAAIMALPVIMELEKLQVEEMSKTRQKQVCILLRKKNFR